MPPNQRLAAVPVVLRVAIGVFALGAVITLLVGLTVGLGGFALGAVTVVLPALAITAVYGLLAFQLYQGSRLARALAVVASPTLLLLALGTSGMTGSAWWIVVGLATTVAAGVPVLAPSARAYLLGPWSRTPSCPVSVMLVRIVAVVVGALAALSATAMLIFGVTTVGAGVAASSAYRSDVGDVLGGLGGLFGGFMIALALVYGAVGAFWLWAARALARASRGARVAVTVVCALNVLPALIAIAEAPGVTLAVLALHAALVGALWLPTDARRHFGDTALPAVEQWHQQAVAFGDSAAAGMPPHATPQSASPFAHRGTPPWPAPPAPLAHPVPAPRHSGPQAPVSPPYGYRAPLPRPTGPSPLPPPTTSGPVLRPSVPSMPSVPVPGPRHAADPVTAPIALPRPAGR